jgi:tRNA(Phe) wybutosine-synthesizing methylase Tyw3
MAINLQKIAEITGTKAESTKEMEWSVGRKKTLETMKSDWASLVKKEITKMQKGKSRMVTWGNNVWRIRLVKSTETLLLTGNEVFEVGDTSGSKVVAKKILEQLVEQIKAGAVDKEILQHMDKCREKRNKYK